MSWDFLNPGILTSLNTNPKQNSSISGIVWSFLLAFVHAKLLSHVQLFVTPWTVTHQAPLSTGFPRQEYWSGLPFPSPGDLSNPRVEPGLLYCRWILYWLSHQGIILSTGIKVRGLNGLTESTSLQAPASDIEDLPPCKEIITSKATHHPFFFLFITDFQFDCLKD